MDLNNTDNLSPAINDQSNVSIDNTPTSNSSLAPALEDQSGITITPSLGNPIEDQSGVTLDSDKYGTTGQQILTGVEGVGQGILGPVSSAIENIPGSIGASGKALYNRFINNEVPKTEEEAKATLNPIIESLSPEEQLARQQTNPIIHTIGEVSGLVGGAFLPGISVSNLAGESAEAAGFIGELNTAGKIAQGFIKGAISTAILQSSDEASRALINDPESSVASALTNIGAAGLLGGVLGTISPIVSSALQKTRLNQFLYGIGTQSIFSDEDKMYPAFSSLLKTNDAGEVLDSLEKPIKEYDSVIDPQTYETISKSPAIYASPKTPEGLNSYKYTHATNVPWDENNILMQNHNNPNANWYTLDNGTLINSDEYNVALGSALTKTQTAKQGIQRFLDKVEAYAPNTGVDPDIAVSYAKKGIKAFKSVQNQFFEGLGLGSLVGFEHGYSKDGWIEGFKDAAMGAVIGSATQSIGSSAFKKLFTPYGTPLLFKALGDTTNPQRIYQTLKYGNAVYKGINIIDKGINNLFIPLPQQLYNSSISNSDKTSLDNIINSGGINNGLQQLNSPQENPQGYAEGGYVEPKLLNEQTIPTFPQQNLLNDTEGIAQVLPQHNILLNAAKSRISNYLTSIKPQINQPKLAFDSVPDNSEADKSYNKALDIAIRPLSVLDHIASGKIEPEHIKHLNSMYPEVVNELNKRITKKITESQLKGEKPAYHIRQGLSMLLGTPLSGEMVPQNIQAAQNGYSTQQSQIPQQQKQPKQVRKTAVLNKVSNSYMTAEQSREQRLNKQ